MKGDGRSGVADSEGLGEQGSMAKRLVGLLLAAAAALLPPACNGTRLCLPRELAESADGSAVRLGGKHGQRPCVPKALGAPRNLIDLCGDPDAHAPVPANVVREAEDVMHRLAAERAPPGGRPYHFLALSSGGVYGPFGVGVLSGWTQSGTRPTFDVVTGVSVGSLIATFAFLGPQYDSFLRESLVGVTRRDLFRRRPLLAVFCSDSFYSPARLARRIDE